MFAYRRFMLCYPGFEGFANFSNLFGIISFAWESVDHARFCFSGDGVFAFHQGSLKDGRGLVCHFHFCGLGWCPAGTSERPWM